MAPFSNRWLKKAWNKYTEGGPPWIKAGKVAGAVLLGPLIAITTGLADVIQTWAEELILSPAQGVLDVARSLVGAIFYGNRFDSGGLLGDVLSFANIGDVGIGFIPALEASFASPASLVNNLGLFGFVAAIAAVVALAALLGRYLANG